MKIFYPKCMTETISQKVVEPNIYTYIYFTITCMSLLIVNELIVKEWKYTLRI